MTAPRFSVVLPTFERMDVLQQTLDRIAEQDYLRGGGSLEVIAVDDGSTDGTGPFLRKRAERDRRLRVVEQPNLGPAPARNRAVEEASGTILFFLGDDILLAPDALARCDRFFKDPGHARAGFLGNLVQELGDDAFARWLAGSDRQHIFHELQQSGNVEWRYVEACLFAVLREELGPDLRFREDLRYYENLEWAHRLKRAGFEFYFDKECIGRHRHPVTLQGYLERSYRTGRTLPLLVREDLGLLPVRWNGRKGARLVLDGLLARLRVPGARQRYWRGAIHRALARGYADAGGPPHLD